MSQRNIAIPNPQAPHTGAWVRGAIIALLLLALMATSGVTFQYLQNGRPISRITGVPGPLAGLFDTPPQYDTSIYGIAAPMGVASAPDGTIYVTEANGERMVRRFDGSGNLLAAFAPPETQPGARVPVYLAISPNGDVYVTDREAQTIYVYSRSGELVGHVPSPFGDEGWQPLGVSFDHEGNLYVTEVTPEKHRVLVLDPNGNLKLQFGKQGTADGDFYFPNAVVVDGKGRMFVSDGNNGRVQVFDQGGSFLGSIGRGANKGDLALPRGLAIDDNDHLLFVVDAGLHAVQVYDIAGATPTFAATFGNSGNEETDLAFPAGISLDGHGRAYVADREHGRITVWRY
jgi:DNA-binding beta-propeller fold protein YncE